MTTKKLSEPERHAIEKRNDPACFDNSPFAEGFNDHDPGDEHR